MLISSQPKEDCFLNNKQKGGFQMFKLFLACLLSFLCLMASTPTVADVINFEDIPYQDPGYGPLPTNYAGFEWSDSGYWIAKSTRPGTGYEHGTLGIISAFDWYAQDLSFRSLTPFNFNSCYITAAWLQNLDVRVEGWRNGDLVASQTITTHRDQPYLFVFNLENIDKVLFSPLTISDGESHFVLDNLNCTPVPVPLPPSALLLGGGLVYLFFRNRNKRKSAS